MSEGRFLRTIREGHWEYAERINANGAVMVIAMTPQREMILVEEYRYPMHARTIGLPAGISGDHGEESKLVTAQRELLEESGYEADEWEFLFEGPSSPGLATEMVGFFLARGLRKVSEGGGIDHEDIDVHLVPVDQIEPWLAGQTSQGKVIDPRIYAGLYFLMTRAVPGFTPSKCLSLVDGGEGI